MGEVLIPLAAIILIFGGGAAVLLSITPVGKAVAARIMRKAAANDDTTQELEDLRREVEEMRHLPEQVSELGERVDFLERLVAKQREAERLPPVR